MQTVQSSVARRHLLSPVRQMHIRTEPVLVPIWLKDKYLEEELEKINKNDATTWSSIITNGGSVQHLSFCHQR